MTGSADDTLSMFKQGLREASQQRKSDDLIDYIKSNWKFFCCSKSEFTQICDELEQRNDMSVDALLEALGVPGNVVFKKTKVVDVAKLMLHFQTSALYKLFDTQLGKRSLAGKGKELCMFAIAGTHSVVLTNMRTATEQGMVKYYLVGAANGQDVEVFPAKEAAARLPGLFSKVIGD